MQNEIASAIEAQLAALAAACPIALIGLDFDAHVRLWNHAAEQIFKWTAAEVLGRRLPIGASMEAELLSLPRNELFLRWPTRDNGSVEICVRVAAWLGGEEGVLLMIARSIGRTPRAGRTSAVDHQ
jgi:PAS domain-containing protein